MLWFPAVLIVSFVVQGQGKYGSRCTIGAESGFCVPWKSCKSVYDRFEIIRQRGVPMTASEQKNFQDLHCGTFKNVHHVCCTKSDVRLNPEGLSILEKEDCGRYATTKLTNSNEALLSEYPWMALLIYDDENNPYRCGGSLITDQYVLTAAHCIRKSVPPILLKIRLGEHRKSTDPDCISRHGVNICAPPFVEVGINETIVHPEYTTMYNDIALIRLDRKVELQKHIKTVCLPIYDDLRNKVHDQYVVSGWGRTETGKDSDVLRAAVMPRVDLRTCANQLRPYQFTAPLNIGHICAGGEQLVDSCKGDSGGPMGFTDTYDGRPRFVQFGVVASGLRFCGEVNVPGIYTNVQIYLQWITDHIRLN